MDSFMFLGPQTGPRSIGVASLIQQFKCVMPCFEPPSIDTDPDSFLYISSLDKFMSKNEGSLSPSAFAVHLSRRTEGLPPLASSEIALRSLCLF